ncbi:UNVERIFIED_CONTAM: hypothetical protein GTU68_046099 [Idotea baltica]|nr:hypothetical protein [Idotea baltica]
MNADEAISQRFKIIVAYDGRPFSGWQSQPGGNTVQDILLGALQSICPAITMVQGSGRTDAGVSADGQVAHFDAPPGWRMNSTEWRKALNSKLPAAIRIFDAQPVPPDFHARFSAEAKTYRYRIYTGEVLPPLFHGLVWHDNRIHDFAALENAARLFEGTHDFRPFSAKRNDGYDEERDTVRTIYSVDLIQIDDHECELEFVGNGFLYKMVRVLVGSSVEVSNGKREVPEIHDRLKSGLPFLKAPFCAPSDGLRLVNVRYPDFITP